MNEGNYLVNDYQGTYPSEEPIITWYRAEIMKQAIIERIHIELLNNGVEYDADVQYLMEELEKAIGNYDNEQLIKAYAPIGDPKNINMFPEVLYAN